MSYYLLDENKNLVEVIDIEANLFRTILAKIKSELTGQESTIEFVTQAQYNQLEEQGRLVGNCYYFITDDTTAEDLEDSIDGIMDGTNPPPNAEEADTATNSKNAEKTDFTNVPWRGYEYNIHLDQHYYATIPANEVQGEGCYLVQFLDNRNNSYALGIIYRFGSAVEKLRSASFIAIDDNDQLRNCYLEAKEQSDGSVKINIWAWTQQNSVTEFESTYGYIGIKKIR